MIRLIVILIPLILSSHLKAQIKITTLSALRAITDTKPSAAYKITDYGGGIFKDLGVNNGTYTDNTGIVIITGDKHVLRRVFTGAADITWFGAKGDADDNATAIQSALTSTTNIYIPDQTFIVGSSLHLKEGQTISGAGVKSVLKAKKEYIKVLSAISVSHITIKNLSIDGGGQSGNAAAGLRGVDGIFVDNVTNWEIANVTIKYCGVTNKGNPKDDANDGGFGILIESSLGETAFGNIKKCDISYIAGGGYYRGDGIYVGSQNNLASIFTHNIKITGCNITKTGRHAIAVASGTISVAKNISIDNCRVSNTALCGIDIEPANFVDIDTCNFSFCGNDQTYYNPVKAYGVAYGLLAGISVTNSINNISVANSHFSNCYYAFTYGAVKFLCVKKCTAENSKISDLYQFLASGPTDFILEDCRFMTPTNITNFYYRVGNSDAKAENCVFAGSVECAGADGFIFNKCVFKRGFYFKGANQKKIVFNDCNFEDFKGDGISFRDINMAISDITVKGCRFIGSGKMQYGIHFLYKDADRWLVDANTFTGQSIAAIYHSNASESQVFTNCINNTFNSCGSGIHIEQAILNSNISNNTFNRITGWCIQITNIVSSTSAMSGVNISNNTALDHCVNGLKIEVSTGIWINCSLVKNNMINCSGTKWSLSSGAGRNIISENIIAESQLKNK